MDDSGKKFCFLLSKKNPTALQVDCKQRAFTLSLSLALISVSHRVETNEQPVRWIHARACTWDTKAAVLPVTQQPRLGDNKTAVFQVYCTCCLSSGKTLRFTTESTQMQMPKIKRHAVVPELFLSWQRSKCLPCPGQILHCYRQMKMGCVTN